MILFRLIESYELTLKERNALEVFLSEIETKFEEQFSISNKELREMRINIQNKEEILLETDSNFKQSNKKINEFESQLLELNNAISEKQSFIIKLNNALTKFDSIKNDTSRIEKEKYLKKVQVLEAEVFFK